VREPFERMDLLCTAMAGYPVLEQLYLVFTSSPPTTNVAFSAYSIGLHVLRAILDLVPHAKAAAAVAATATVGALVALLKTACILLLSIHLMASTYEAAAAAAATAALGAMAALLKTGCIILL
jgi:hypothetical protein